jgi:hypothetical protein
MDGSEQHGKTGIEGLVLAQLSAEERRRCVAYLDRRPLPAGRNVIGNRRLDLREPRWVAFVDERPGATWAHPCRYLVIDPASRGVEAILADSPPEVDVLPSTWRVVWRPHGTEDWRLIRIFRHGPDLGPGPDKDRL